MDRRGDSRLVQGADRQPSHPRRRGSLAFFVPPYVGPKGWVGMRLDDGTSSRSSSEAATA